MAATTFWPSAATSCANVTPFSTTVIIAEGEKADAASNAENTAPGKAISLSLKGKVGAQKTMTGYQEAVSVMKIANAASLLSLSEGAGGMVSPNT